MWSKSALLLTVRVKVQGHRGFTFPIPVWVVDEFLTALTDLAWVGERVLMHIPLYQDERARKHLNWVKTISPSGVIELANKVIKDLRNYKGMDVVDVKTKDVDVKVSLR